MSEQPTWYFTAPWDPVPVRRGDALGFRAAADYFAELVAPGLNNGTSDARWISLLSWCLRWSHVAWQNAGGADLSRREAQRDRYAWLRPLELLWVARTLVSDEQATGQLRGRRSVQRWLEERALPNFAMSSDQFRRYRQIGTYGAYRVVFRTVAGLTTGDGWTPGPTALELAKLVDDRLPPAVRIEHERLEQPTKWGRWRGGNEARYWIERGWPRWCEEPRGFLPTPDDAASTPLPHAERRLLEPALFGADSTRRVTAEVLAHARGASSHANLCEALAGSSELSRQVAPASLGPLPAFSRFADAAMHAMRGLWNEINRGEVEQAPAVETLARSSTLQARIDVLDEAGATWLDEPGRRAFRHEHVVTSLAQAVRDAKSPAGRLRALARHHHDHGGGRRWFHERRGTLVSLVRDTGLAASDYRFRLRSLCRLAAQCGVADMNHPLDTLAQQDPDDEEGEPP